MADQEQPLLTEGEGDGVGAAEPQGPVLDLDMIITRLLGYKERPGKQVLLEKTFWIFMACKNCHFCNRSTYQRVRSASCVPSHVRCFSRSRCCLSLELRW